MSLLAGHPWFELTVLTSRRGAGLRYGEAVRWVLDTPLPQEAADIELSPTKPEAVREAELVFVALPSEAAAGIEVELAKMGKVVVSNASIYRLDSDVPLLNPEVNWDHIKLLDVQRRLRGWRGALLKVPNCTTSILTLSLKPLADLAGLESVTAVTMQSISGAGFSGVPGYMITDNIVPFIEGEEEKVSRETLKIMASLGPEGLREPEMLVTATTTRVPVLDGHLEVVYASYRRDVELQEVIDSWTSWRSTPQELSLPTAPEAPVVYVKERDRPQPRLDRMAGRGMSVVVGRAEKPFKGKKLLRYVVLGHNTIRGAAGNGVLIAELYYKLYEPSV